MDIFRSRYYSLNVALLSVLGLWPYQRFKKWQLFQQIMCLMSIITVIMSQGVRLLEMWGNTEIMIECITPMGVQVSTSIKFINAIVNRKKMTKLLETIKSDWSKLRNEEEMKIIKKYAEHGRSLTVFWTVFLYCTLFVYLMVPLMPNILDVIQPLNESRTLTYLYQTQYYVDPEEYFLYICLHTYAGTFVTMTCIIAVDTMFACFIMHACGILAIAGHRLENLTPKNSDTDNDGQITSAENDDFEELVSCIDQHYAATEVIKTIESTYSLSFLLILGIAMIMLSISGVQLLIQFGRTEEMIRLIQFISAQFNHLLFNSWPGQKLIDEGIHFRECVYAAEWYSLSERNKHLLRFVMMRTIEPQKITAGKLYVMSMENFGVVIQSSMSYFMVFASIR